MIKSIFATGLFLALSLASFKLEAVLPEGVTVTKEGSTWVFKNNSPKPVSFKVSYPNSVESAKAEPAPLNPLTKLTIAAGVGALIKVAPIIVEKVAWLYVNQLYAGIPRD